MSLTEISYGATWARKSGVCVQHLSNRVINSKFQSSYNKWPMVNMKYLYGMFNFKVYVNLHNELPLFAMFGQLIIPLKVFC